MDFIHCGCIATDPDIALSISSGCDLTMAPRFVTHISLLLSIPESAIPSLFMMLNLLCFSFSPICAYLHVVVAPTAGWPHWQTPG